MKVTMVRKNLLTGRQGALHMIRMGTARIVRLDMCLRLGTQDRVFRATLEHTQITTLVKLFAKLALQVGIQQTIQRTLYVWNVQLENITAERLYKILVRTATVATTLM
jgi:hypothetical protein